MNDREVGFPSTATPGDVVRMMYETLSGPAGVDRDWGRFRQLVDKYARLFVSSALEGGEETWGEWTVDEYVEQFREEYGHIDYWEREVSSHVDQYENIAQVLSVAETTFGGGEGGRVVRTVNSFHLLRRDGRWWIVSALWAVEQPGKPVPPEFLS